YPAHDGTRRTSLCAALRVSNCYRELVAPPGQSNGNSKSNSNSNSALIRPSGTFSALHSLRSPQAGEGQGWWQSFVRASG
ncbi:hypothetical protein, partial [Pseudomonas sp. CGJS7]|uniref:hypothetical protein n=1 Tax=Pseudomonas sp. CGJS7 TaxID=3109348 RepID=UPI00300BF818